MKSNETPMSSRALISDLAEEDRNSVEAKVKLLLSVLRTCEVYLQDYAAGKQTVGKFLISTEMVRVEMVETHSLLIEKHKLAVIDN